jgi:hypothetical protein
MESLFLTPQQQQQQRRQSLTERHFAREWTQVPGVPDPNEVLARLDEWTRRIYGGSSYLKLKSPFARLVVNLAAVHPGAQWLVERYGPEVLKSKTVMEWLTGTRDTSKLVPRAIKIGGKTVLFTDIAQAARMGGLSQWTEKTIPLLKEAGLSGERAPRGGILTSLAAGVGLMRFTHQFHPYRFQLSDGREIRVLLPEPTPSAQQVAGAVGELLITGLITGGALAGASTLPAMVGRGALAGAAIGATRAAAQAAPRPEVAKAAVTEAAFFGAYPVVGHLLGVVGRQFPRVAQTVAKVVEKLPPRVTSALAESATMAATEALVAGGEALWERRVPDPREFGLRLAYAGAMGFLIGSLGRVEKVEDLAKLMRTAEQRYRQYLQASGTPVHDAYIKTFREEVKRKLTSGEFVKWMPELRRKVWTPAQVERAAKLAWETPVAPPRPPAPQRRRLRYESRLPDVIEPAAAGERILRPEELPALEAETHAWLTQELMRRAREGRREIGVPVLGEPAPREAEIIRPTPTPPAEAEIAVPRPAPTPRPEAEVVVPVPEWRLRNQLAELERTRAQIEERTATIRTRLESGIPLPPATRQSLESELRNLSVAYQRINDEIVRLQQQLARVPTERAAPTIVAPEEPTPRVTGPEAVIAENATRLANEAFERGQATISARKVQQTVKTAKLPKGADRTVVQQRLHEEAQAQLASLWNQSIERYEHFEALVNELVGRAQREGVAQVTEAWVRRQLADPALQSKFLPHKGWRTIISRNAKSLAESVQQRLKPPEALPPAAPAPTPTPPAEPTPPAVVTPPPPAPAVAVEPTAPPAAPVPAPAVEAPLQILQKYTVESATAPDMNLGGAAIIEKGRIIGWHVTDNPQQVLKSLKSESPIVQTAHSLGTDAFGRGLYVSAVPDYWYARGKSTGKILQSLSHDEILRLTDVLERRIIEQQTSGYITAEERDYALAIINEVRRGNYDTTYLGLLTTQPYNIRITDELLQSAGITREVPKPSIVRVEIEGRFLDMTNLSRDEKEQLYRMAMEWAQSKGWFDAQWNLTPKGKRNIRTLNEVLSRYLQELGYHGAFYRSSVGTEPQLVVWDNTAVRSFGDWRNPRPSPLRQVKKPSVSPPPTEVPTPTAPPAEAPRPLPEVPPERRVVQEVPAPEPTVTAPPTEGPPVRRETPTTPDPEIDPLLPVLREEMQNPSLAGQVFWRVYNQLARIARSRGWQVSLEAAAGKLMSRGSALFKAPTGDYVVVHTPGRWRNAYGVLTSSTPTPDEVATLIKAAQKIKEVTPFTGKKKPQTIPPERQVLQEVPAPEQIKKGDRMVVPVEPEQPSIEVEGKTDMSSLKQSLGREAKLAEITGETGFMPGKVYGVGKKQVRVWLRWKDKSIYFAREVMPEGIKKGDHVYFDVPITQADDVEIVTKIASGQWEWRQIEVTTPAGPKKVWVLKVAGDHFEDGPHFGRRRGAAINPFMAIRRWLERDDYADDLMPPGLQVDIRHVKQQVNAKLRWLLHFRSPQQVAMRAKSPALLEFFDQATETADNIQRRFIGWMSVAENALGGLTEEDAILLSHALQDPNIRASLRPDLRARADALEALHQDIASVLQAHGFRVRQGFDFTHILRGDEVVTIHFKDAQGNSQSVVIGTYETFEEARLAALNHIQNTLMPQGATDFRIEIVYQKNLPPDAWWLFDRLPFQRLLQGIERLARQDQVAMETYAAYMEQILRDPDLINPQSPKYDPKLAQGAEELRRWLNGEIDSLPKTAIDELRSRLGLKPAPAPWWTGQRSLNLETYERDLRKVIPAYIKSVARAVHNRALRQLERDILGRYPDIDPQEAMFLRDYRDALTGGTYWLALFDRFMMNLGVPKYHRQLAYLNSLASIKYLGVNLAKWLLNRTQPYMFTGNLVGHTRVLAALPKMYQALSGKPVTIRGVQFTAEELAQTARLDLQDFRWMAGMERYLPEGFGKATELLMMPFTSAEAPNRMQSLIAGIDWGWEILGRMLGDPVRRQALMDGKTFPMRADEKVIYDRFRHKLPQWAARIEQGEAMEAVLKDASKDVGRWVVDTSQFRQDISDMPMFISKGGAVGRTLFQFMNFAVKQMEFLFSPTTPPLTRLKTWATIAAMAGLFGLPFADEIDWAIQKLSGGKWSLKRTLLMRAADPSNPERWVYKLLYYGAPSWVGIDWSQSLGAPLWQLTARFGIVRETPWVGMEVPLWVKWLKTSPGASWTYDTIAAAIDYIKTPNDTTLRRFLYALVPIGVARALQAYYAHEEGTLRSSVKGRPVLTQVDAWTTIPLALGFLPERVSTVRNLQRELREVTQEWAAERQQLAGLIAGLVVKGWREGLTPEESQRLDEWLARFHELGGDQRQIDAHIQRLQGTDIQQLLTGVAKKDIEGSPIAQTLFQLLQATRGE